LHIQPAFHFRASDHARFDTGGASAIRRLGTRRARRRSPRLTAAPTTIGDRGNHAIDRIEPLPNTCWWSTSTSCR